MVDEGTASVFSSASSFKDSCFELFGGVFMSGMGESTLTRIMVWRVLEAAGVNDLRVGETSDHNGREKRRQV